MSPKNRTFSVHPYTSPLFTRTRQIIAFVLVTATFFFTRLFDQLFPPSTCYTNLDRPSPSLNLHVAKTDSAGHLPWPERGYGSHLNLKIYVYDENEIDGLKKLLHGRDGSISTTTCLKGQWGSQVKIQRLLQESQFRTREKEEANLFFVPAYAKCVRMTGGLSDKEINQTYVKVLSQMSYFRRSGGNLEHLKDVNLVVKNPNYGLELLQVYPLIELLNLTAKKENLVEAVQGIVFVILIPLTNFIVYLYPTPFNATGISFNFF